MKKLAELAEIRGGTALKKGRNDAVFVQGRNIRGGEFRLMKPVFGMMPKRGGEDAILRNGDVLIDTRGKINWAVCFEGHEAVSFASLDLAIIRPQTKYILPKYLALYINLPATQATLEGHRSTATIPKLKLAALSQMQIPVPPIERQRTMVAIEMEAKIQKEIQRKLDDAQQRFTNEILRLSAKDAPMPDGNPAWAINRQMSLAQDHLATPSQTMETIK